MISVISGKRYNTETATEVATHSRGQCGDLDSCSETLYKTPSGTYFAHYDVSIRAAAECNGSATAHISPLSMKEALQWCEERGCGDKASAEFGELIVDA